MNITIMTDNCDLVTGTPKPTLHIADHKQSLCQKEWRKGNSPIVLGNDSNGLQPQTSTTFACSE